MSSNFPPREWLEEHAGLTIKEAARRWGCGPTTMRRYYLVVGVERIDWRAKNGGGAGQRIGRRSREWLEEHATIPSHVLAAELGCTGQTVRRMFAEAGVKYRPKRKDAVVMTPTKKWLEERARLPLREVAAAWGVDESTMCRYYRRAGVEREARAAAWLRPKFKPDPEWLLERASRPVDDVAAELGCTKNTVYDIYRRAGIKRVLQKKKMPRHEERCELCRHRKLCDEIEPSGARLPCQPDIGLLDDREPPLDRIDDRVSLRGGHWMAAGFAHTARGEGG